MARGVPEAHKMMITRSLPEREIDMWNWKAQSRKRVSERRSERDNA